MVVRVPELIQHVLRNPNSYPGPHNQSQDRTSKGFQKIDTQRQLRLIWDAIITRLAELLQSGHSVAISQFGTFSYAPVWHESKYGPDYVSKTPTFVPSNQLKAACPRYHCKELLDVDRGAISSSQSVPNKVRFLNEVPIAGGCYYRADVVRSAVKQIFSAIVDLADRGYELELNMGAVLFKVKNRSLEAVFERGLMAKHAQPDRVKSAHPTEKDHTLDALPSLSSTWKTPEFSKSMAGFLERPASREVHSTRIGTANLAVMGKDLTTCS